MYTNFDLYKTVLGEEESQKPEVRYVYNRYSHINMEITDEELDRIMLEYGGTINQYAIEEFPNGLRFCGNRFYLMYSFPNGYAIFEIKAYKKYELVEVIGEVTEGELKGLDHDSNHRAWISREYNTKTPVLLYDKRDYD